MRPGPASPAPTRRRRELRARRPPSSDGRLSRLADRQFKYLAITPAVVVLLLIGLFPIIYSAVVSFQNINMLEEDTSFSGLLNYARLFHDLRLWQALLHTLLLPRRRPAGRTGPRPAMAYLFLERMPGRQVFVALLVLPTVISPIVAGATWRLLFDNRFGPINQIMGWIAGQELTAALDRQSEPCLSGDPHLRDLAVDAVHVPDAAGGALQRRPDRCSRRRRSTARGFGVIFLKIVLPAIWPVLAIAVLIRASTCSASSTSIWALTGGGPGTMTETISIYAYVQGFQQFETSYTAAMAFADPADRQCARRRWRLRRMEIAR